MSKEYVPTTLQIIKCFEEEEFNEVFDLLNKAQFSVEPDATYSITQEEFDGFQLAADDRHMTVYGNIAFGGDEELEAYLEDKGMPFKRWSANTDEYEHQLVMFDGVRKHNVLSDKEGNALVDMRALRSIIDMLEDGLEPRALFYANENWIETDINNCWRYGMEQTLAFSPNAVDPNADAIDVEVQEDEPKALEDKDA